MKIILIVNVKTNWRGKEKPNTAAKEEAGRFFLESRFLTLFGLGGTLSSDFP